MEKKNRGTERVKHLSEVTQLENRRARGSEGESGWITSFISGKLFNSVWPQESHSPRMGFGQNVQESLWLCPSGRATCLQSSRQGQSLSMQGAHVEGTETWNQRSCCFSSGIRGLVVSALSPPAGQTWAGHFTSLDLDLSYPLYNGDGDTNLRTVGILYVRIGHTIRWGRGSRLLRGPQVTRAPTWMRVPMPHIPQWTLGDMVKLTKASFLSLAFKSFPSWPLTSLPRSHLTTPPPGGPALGTTHHS